MKSRVRLIPIASIILISSTFSLSGCKLKRELAVPFAETTVNETVISDTKINDIQTCEAKETEIDETQMRETKKDTLTGEIVYLKAQVSDAFILNELTNCFLGCDETTAQDYLVKPYYDYLEEHIPPSESLAIMPAASSWRVKPSCEAIYISLEMMSSFLIL